jgi:hypothetical protein
VGRAEVRIDRTTDALYSNFTLADTILLTSFGHGARFRSNYRPRHRPPFDGWARVWTTTT